MGRTLLMDADITAYQIASSLETVMVFGDQEVQVADAEKGKREVANHIDWVIDHTDSDAAVLMLTGTKNYRKQVLDTYKGNRVGVKKPVILMELRQYMRDNFTVFEEDILEGDDLLGIHATMPHKGERVIYSADKDLKTVPALHWDEEDGEVIQVEPHDADRFFFEQILTGDPTDNYKGCPGVGKVAAKAFLEKPYVIRGYEHEFSRGPRKGTSETRYRTEPLEVHNYIDIWRGIVSFYEKAGLTEQDALIQARCARILRHGEYNFKTQEVKLWTPN